MSDPVFRVAAGPGVDEEARKQIAARNSRSEADLPAMHPPTRKQSSPTPRARSAFH